MKPRWDFGYSKDETFVGSRSWWDVWVWEYEPRKFTVHIVDDTGAVRERGSRAQAEKYARNFPPEMLEAFSLGFSYLEDPSVSPRCRK